VTFSGTEKKMGLEEMSCLKIIRNRSQSGDDFFLIQNVAWKRAGEKNVHSVI